MRLFITSSFGDSPETIDSLCGLAREAGFEDFSFIRDIEKYQKIFIDPKELMRRSAEQIAKSDALLIDMTDKPTGRAIEAGIAYSLGKKIVVLMAEGTIIKDTTRGIADIIIEYGSPDDIRLGLEEARRQWC